MLRKTILYKKYPCKILVKSTHVVNFISILRLAFTPIYSWTIILQSLTVIREKQEKALSYKKGAHKKLMKSTPCQYHSLLLALKRTKQFFLSSFCLFKHFLTMCMADFTMTLLLAGWHRSTDWRGSATTTTGTRRARTNTFCIFERYFTGNYYSRLARKHLHYDILLFSRFWKHHC